VVFVRRLLHGSDHGRDIGRTEHGVVRCYCVVYWLYLGKELGNMAVTHCKRGHERTPENLNTKRACKECMREKNKQWKRDHPEYRALVYTRRRDRRTGWTEELFKAALEKQGGKCVTCNVLMTFEKNGSVGTRASRDHDHDTNEPKPRELLCSNCNMLLGHIENREHLLPALIAYLRKHGK
jgi:hypothetical protein